MIQAIGVDLVDINRFEHWHLYNDTQLRRIFSQHEIDYAKSEPLLSAQRFAARFAVKEAAYKALSSSLPFLSACKAIQTKIERHKPILIIDWLLLAMNPQLCFVSISHTPKIAIGMVVLQKIDFIGSHTTRARKTVIDK